MLSPIHILNQLGVLTSFSVAKKVTEEDINKYFSKYKKSGKSEKQIGEMLKDKILLDINNAVENNEIPGIVTPQELAESLGVDKKVIERMPDINRLVSIIAQKMIDKQYDKMSLCYFINSLVNILNLTEDDFTKFHRQNNKNDGNDEDNDNGEDDDGDDDNGEVF